MDGGFHGVLSRAVLSWEPGPSGRAGEPPMLQDGASRDRGGKPLIIRDRVLHCKMGTSGESSMAAAKPLKNNALVTLATRVAPD
jgi:hypothetical protein